MKVQNVKELPSTPVGGWGIGAGMVPYRSPPQRHQVGREWITLRRHFLKRKQRCIIRTRVPLPNVGERYTEAGREQRRHDAAHVLGGCALGR
jgi:hypothetical protein